MLVVISDLHFVDATAGDHNLPPEAFEEIFFYNILELAKRKKAQELKILLLGDMPDLIRSTRWLDAPPEHRPWGAAGLADVANWRALRPGQPPTPTEAICNRILGCLPASGRREDVPDDTILAQNWDTFAFFRQLAERVHRHGKLAHIPVELIYVPGNHDRLVNLYPSVRDAWQEMAGLTVHTGTVDIGADGQWWFPNEWHDRDYHLYARHGHQYDLWNYAGGNDLTRRPAHLQVPIGDVLATEFAVRLPWEAEKYPEIIDAELLSRLQDMDNVRPVERLLEWFYWELEKDDHPQAVRRTLDKVADDVVKAIAAIPFVRQWRTPVSSWSEMLDALPWLSPATQERLATAVVPGWDEVTRLVTQPWLRWLFGKLMDVTDTGSLLGFLMPLVGRHSHPEEDAFMQAAFREHIWRTTPDIHFVIYGHTHSPTIFPLDAANGHEVFYINTGTWRQRIRRTVGLDRLGEFVQLKQMSYAILYRPDEDGGGPDGNKAPGTVSFDMWTGHKFKHYR